VQQNVPQHVPAVHVIMHAGMATQFPLSQNGVAPEQTVPQPPQCCGSL
jgi:hypothetical protein